MNKKKKVLIITEAFKFGGTNLVAIRLQQAIDSNKFECTYCVRHNNENETMDDYVENLGVNVIYHPKDKLSYKDSYKFYLDLFENEHFDIVHSHYPFYSVIPMIAAYKCGVKKRITHSHFSFEVYNNFSKIKHLIVYIYRIIVRKLLCVYSTDMLACSVPAGEYLFGKRGYRKKGRILNNGIEIQKYKFNPEIRSKVRKEFNLENKIVLGHVGAMYYIKNQNFLIDVFFEFQKKHCDSVLMLVGDGQDSEKLKEKCNALNIEDKVIFTGLRNDANELLMAMDCMVFPSLHEGFPLTLIEAQVSKLACVVSDSVIKDVKLNDNFCFVSLNDDVSIWVDAIENQLKRDRASVDNSKVIDEFDIEKIVKELENIYLN